MSKLPLAGVRILSLAEQYPGPFATMLLADLGADVILVERPNGGDPSRRFAGLFASLNRNKRSVTLDLKSAQGHADFLALVDSADVVVEGYRPGVMAKLELGADLLRTRKPSLIVVSISSFGQTGPSVGIAGHDLSIQGAAGMLKIPLGEEAAAALPVLPLADISSAMFAALGIVTALFDRSKTGVGTAIDVSMLDSLVSWMAPFLVPPMNNLPTRALPPDDPGYGIFATADARQITLSIAGEDHMWATLCAVLELPALAALNEQQRSDQRRDITPLLRSAILRWPCDALCQRLEAERIAFGPVLQLHEVLTDAQMVARGMAVELHSDGCNSDLSLPRKPRIFVRQPLLMDGTQPEPMLPVPALGQHNIAILGKLHGA